MDAQLRYTPRLGLSRLWDRAETRGEKAGVVLVGLATLPLHLLDGIACGLAACRGKPLLDRSVIPMRSRPIQPQGPDRKHASADAIVTVHRPDTSTWTIEPGVKPEELAKQIADRVSPFLRSGGAYTAQDSRGLPTGNFGWTADQKVLAAGALMRNLLTAGVHPGTAMDFTLGMVFPPAMIHKSNKALDLNGNAGNAPVMEELFRVLFAAAGGPEKIAEPAVSILLSSSFPASFKPAFLDEVLGSRVRRMMPLAEKCRQLGLAHPVIVSARQWGPLIGKNDRRELYQQLHDVAAKSCEREFRPILEGVLRALTHMDPTRKELASTTVGKFNQLAKANLDALEDAFKVLSPHAAIVRELVAEARKGPLGSDSKR